jgi:hypothetical protein
MTQKLINPCPHGRYLCGKKAILFAVGTHQAVRQSQLNVPGKLGGHLRQQNLGEKSQKVNVLL